MIRPLFPTLLPSIGIHRFIHYLDFIVCDKLTCNHTVSTKQIKTKLPKKTKYFGLLFDSTCFPPASISFDQGLARRLLHSSSIPSLFLHFTCILPAGAFHQHFHHPADILKKCGPKIEPWGTRDSTIHYNKIFRHFPKLWA